MSQSINSSLSEQQPNDSNQQLRVSREYRWALMILTAVCCWVLTISVQPTGFPAIFLVVLGLLLLYRARLVWAIAYLFLLGWTIYISDPIIGTAVEPPSFLFALLATIFLGVSCRYSEVARLQRAIELPAEEGLKPIEPLEFFMILFTSRWFGAYAAVCTATLLMATIPRSYQALWQFGLKIGWGQWILTVLGLGSFWIVCRYLLDWIRRSDSSPAVLEVEARSMINDEFYRETAGVEKRRAKYAGRLRARE